MSVALISLVSTCVDHIDKYPAGQIPIDMMLVASRQVKWSDVEDELIQRLKVPGKVKSLVFEADLEKGMYYIRWSK